MKVGRPAKWNSPEELSELIEAYFIDCKEREEPPMITEMCVFLDTTRETLLDYQSKDGFSDTIKRAKTRCEAAVEKGILLGKMNATAGIFNLKNNYGWRDKTEQDITTGGEKLVFLPNEVINKLHGTTQQTKGNNQL
jgi:hypothetical protein